MEVSIPRSTRHGQLLKAAIGEAAALDLWKHIALIEIQQRDEFGDVDETYISNLEKDAIESDDYEKIESYILELVATQDVNKFNDLQEPNIQLKQYMFTTFMFEMLDDQLQPIVLNVKQLKKIYDFHLASETSYKEAAKYGLSISFILRQVIPLVAPIFDVEEEASTIGEINFKELFPFPLNKLDDPLDNSTVLQLIQEALMKATHGPTIDFFKRLQSLLKSNGNMDDLQSKENVLPWIEDGYKVVLDHYQRLMKEIDHDIQAIITHLNNNNDPIISSLQGLKTLLKAQCNLDQDHDEDCKRIIPIEQVIKQIVDKKTEINQENQPWMDTLKDKLYVTMRPTVAPVLPTDEAEQRSEVAKMLASITMKKDDLPKHFQDELEEINTLQNVEEQWQRLCILEKQIVDHYRAVSPEAGAAAVEVFVKGNGGDEFIDVLHAAEERLAAEAEKGHQQDLIQTPPTINPLQNIKKKAIITRQLLIDAGVNTDALDGFIIELEEFEKLQLVEDRETKIGEFESQLHKLAAPMHLLPGGCLHPDAITALQTEINQYATNGASDEKQKQSIVTKIDEMIRAYEDSSILDLPDKLERIASLKTLKQSLHDNNIGTDGKQLETVYQSCQEGLKRVTSSTFGPLSASSLQCVRDILTSPSSNPLAVANALDAIDVIILALKKDKDAHGSIIKELETLKGSFSSGTSGTKQNIDEVFDQVGEAAIEINGVLSFSKLVNLAAILKRRPKTAEEVQKANDEIGKIISVLQTLGSDENGDLIAVLRGLQDSIKIDEEPDNDKIDAICLRISKAVRNKPFTQLDTWIEELEYMKVSDMTVDYFTLFRDHITDEIEDDDARITISLIEFDEHNPKKAYHELVAALKRMRQTKLATHVVTFTPEMRQLYDEVAYLQQRGTDMNRNNTLTNANQQIINTKDAIELFTTHYRESPGVLQLLATTEEEYKVLQAKYDFLYGQNADDNQDIETQIEQLGQEAQIMFTTFRLNMTEVFHKNGIKITDENAKICFRPLQTNFRSNTSENNALTTQGSHGALTTAITAATTIVADLVGRSASVQDISSESHLAIGKAIDAAKQIIGNILAQRTNSTSTVPLNLTSVNAFLHSDQVVQTQTTRDEFTALLEKMVTDNPSNGALSELKQQFDTFLAGNNNDAHAFEKLKQAIVQKVLEVQRVDTEQRQQNAAKEAQTNTANQNKSATETLLTALVNGSQQSAENETVKKSLFEPKNHRLIGGNKNVELHHPINDRTATFESLNAYVGRVYSFLFGKSPANWTIYMNSLNRDNCITLYREAVKNAFTLQFLKGFLDIVYVDITHIVEISEADVHESSNEDYKIIVSSAQKIVNWIGDEKITQDTTNAKYIDETTNGNANISGKHYVHIAGLCSVINIINFQALSTNSTQSTKNLMSSFLCPLLEQHIGEDTTTAYSTFFVNVGNVDLTGFFNLLTSLVMRQNDNMIQTYIKMTNFDAAKGGAISQRFNILTKTSVTNDKLLSVGYHTSPETQKVEYYEKKDGDQLYTLKQPFPKDGERTNFIYGNFTDIFYPEIKNEDIAKRMKPLVDKAIDTKQPIFIIGYGQGGAGKTSALIYLNKGNTQNEKDGVMVHLLKQFGTKGFSELHIALVESYISQGKEIQERVPKTGQGIVFTYDNSSANFQCIVDKNIITQIYLRHEYRVQMLSAANTAVTKPEDLIKNLVVGGTMSLGQYLIFMIDTDRLVKPTTNNPQSSRSHVLAMITMKKHGEEAPVHLFIGDFAGVENKFDHNNIEVLKQFYGIKMDHSYVTQDKTQYYYSNGWPEGEVRNPDPINLWSDSMFGGNVKKYMIKTYGSDFYDIMYKTSRDGRITDSSNYTDAEPYISTQNIEVVDVKLETDVKFFRKDEEIFFKTNKDSEPINGKFIAYQFDDNAGKNVVVTANTPGSKSQVVDITLVTTPKGLAGFYTTNATNINGNNPMSPPLQHIANSTTQSVAVGDLVKINNKTIGKVQNVTDSVITLLYSSDEFGSGDVHLINNTPEERVKLLQNLLKNQDHSKLDAKYFFQKKQQILHNNDVSEIFLEYILPTTDIIQTTQIRVVTNTTLLGATDNYLNNFELDTKTNQTLVIVEQDHQHVDNSEIIRVLKEPSSYRNVQKMLSDVQKTLNQFQPLNMDLVSKINAKVQQIERIMDTFMTEVETTKLNDLWNKRLFKVYYDLDNPGGKRFIDAYRTTLTNFNKKFNAFINLFRMDDTLGFLPYDKTFQQFIQRFTNLADKFVFTTQQMKTEYNIDIENYRTNNRIINYKEGETLNPIRQNNFKKVFENFQSLQQKKFLAFLGKKANQKPMTIIDVDATIKTNQELVAKLLIFKYNEDGLDIDTLKQEIKDIVDSNENVSVKIIELFLQVAENCFVSQVTDEEILKDSPELRKLERKRASVTTQYQRNRIDENTKKLHGKTKDTLTEALPYVEFMQEIVKHRTAEGEFINRSLKDLRNVIRVIARTKNADTIFYSPHFDNQCLTAYCPTGNDCFNISKIEDVEPQSALMNTIFDYLKESKYEDDDANKSQFYKDIIVAVFCVFNVSCSVNNPPATIFIDINPLKHALYENKLHPDMKQIRSIYREIEIFKSTYIGSIPYNLTITNAFDNIVQRYQEIDVGQGDQNRITNFVTSVETFIDVINNHNDATVLGTLEYTDQMSRLNTTSVTCTNIVTTSYTPLENNNNVLDKLQPLGTLMKKVGRGGNSRTRKNKL